MKTYSKPEVKINGYQSSERFTDDWENIFGNGNEIPVSVFTLGDDTSIA